MSIGMAYHNFADRIGRTPTSVEELAQFSEENGSIELATVIRSDNYVILWGTPLMEGGGPVRCLLGYHRDTPTNGGYTLDRGGFVELMESAEFNAFPQCPLSSVVETSADSTVESTEDLLEGFIGSHPDLPPTTADAEEMEEIRADIIRCLRVELTGDVETALRFAPIAEINMYGGEQRTRAAYAATFQFTSSLGAKFEGVSFPEKAQFLNCDSGPYRRYIVVRTVSLVSANDIRVRASSFFVGGQLENGEWKYCDGTKTKQIPLRAYFPEFPAEVELPIMKKERL
ncbi:MAG: hypothetical protein R3C18_23975 [Planctomycetaceae bacterium]